MSTGVWLRIVWYGAVLAVFAAGCMINEVDDSNVARLPAGDVVLAETMLFGPESSGKVFRGAPDGSTRIIGSMKVGPWTDRGNGVWSAPIPMGADGKRVYAESLFVNGRRAVRARFPDVGYFHPEADVEESQSAESSTGRRQTLAPPADVAEKLAAVPADELAFAQLLVHVKWDVARYPIAAFSDGRLSVDGHQMKGWNKWVKGDLYCIENLRSAFDAPGEWFYDAKAGEILYRLLPGETIKDAAVPIEGLETLVAVKGASDVVFENVTFAFSAPVAAKGPSRLPPLQAAAVVSSAAVTVDRSTNVVFRNCRIEKTGGYALWFRERVRGGGAYSCEMTDLGAGGVRIGLHGWKKGEEVTSGVAVDDCLIADGGRFHSSGVGVLLGHASDCSVTHNEIRDLYYTGVSLGWVWGYAGSPSQRNTVAFNHIHDIGKRELADMGGVYTLGTSFGTCVSNNVIHGIHSSSYGGWGLYTDEGSEGVVMENNLVYDTDDASFHQHYGRDNVLRNNILVDSERGQVAVSRAEPHRSLTCERNIIIWSAGDAFVKPGGTKSERAKIDWRRNLWWRSDGVEQFNGTSFAEWCGRVKDEGSVFADPLFADWKKGDFSLNAKSPALALGFVPFDPAKAGRRSRPAK